LPWLLGIATRIIAKRREAERRWQRPLAPDGAGDDGDATADADARIDDERLAPWLATALGQLRPRDRDALVLHVVGDLTIEEVARALEVPPGTIKSRLHRARRILAAQLEVHR
jgi:RNA polymerase sigma-70 factor (ECF subfamily)